MRSASSALGLNCWLLIPLYSFFLCTSAMAAGSDKAADQLGTLRPGTLCLSLFEGYPYMPSRVLGEYSAEKQPALKDWVRKLKDDTVTGCCVMFFGKEKRVEFVEATGLEPFVVHRYV